MLDWAEPLQEAYLAPDGERIVIRVGGNQLGNLYRVDSASDTTADVLVDSDFYDWHAAISPNGRWLAYASDESGRFEVYVRPFPDARTARHQVSAGGGAKPLWSPDGSELFYHGPTHDDAARLRAELGRGGEGPRRALRPARSSYGRCGR